MYVVPSLSIYVLSGIVGALLATGISDNPFGPVSVEPALSTAATTIDVDRSRKGDRLAVTRAGPVANTTIVPKNVGAREYAVGGLSGMPPRPTTRIVQPKSWAMNIPENVVS